MRILFMGTPDFALESIKALYESRHSVVCVITQPDRPKGRGYELCPPPVKEYAAEKNIPVYQPETLKDGAISGLLEKYNPDMIAVVAYGKILPDYVLNYPKYGCVNIHGSLLPAYRGAAPIQRAVQNGEKVSGVTSMYMAQGLDTGDIIFKSEVNVPDDMTGGELFDMLAPLGGELLVKTADAIEAHTAPRTPQEESLSSYAPQIKKQEGEIDWNDTAQNIKNKIRAFNPWPMAYSFIGGKRAVFDSAQVFSLDPKEPGEVLCADENGIVISCLDGALIFKNIKIEGKKRMSAAEFLRGHKLSKGTLFGKG